MNIHAPMDQETETATRAAKPRRRRHLTRLVGAAAILLAGIASWELLNGRPTAPPPAMAPPSVTVATPLERQVVEWDEYVGRFAPSQTVEVRPRVSGAITDIHFEDGSFVEAGQPLFTIDQRPYAAALAEAEAELARAESAHALARTELDRGRRLVQTSAVSRSRVDELEAQLQSAAGAVAAAKARLQSRQLDMEFTEVRAPISGRVSDRRIDRGALVASGEGAGATLLTTINAVDPIYFEFEASEGLYLKSLRDLQAEDADVQIQVRLQDEEGYNWTGRLDFTDNQLDRRSGTIRGRAVFDNPDGFLTPGLFGNMRLSTGRSTDTLLVPEAAVTTDQAGKAVLTVNADDTVSARTVTLGPVIDGLRIVRSGLTPDDRVVISGIQSAMTGATVSPQAGTIVPDATRSAQAVSTPISAQATFAGR